MPQFKVELLSIDRNDETKNIEYSTFIDAIDSNDAVSKAKVKQKQERSDLNPADRWLWSSYQTAEEHD